MSALVQFIVAALRTARRVRENAGDRAEDDAPRRNAEAEEDEDDQEDEDEGW